MLTDNCSYVHTYVCMTCSYNTVWYVVMCNWHCSLQHGRPVEHIAWDVTECHPPLGLSTGYHSLCKLHSENSPICLVHVCGFSMPWYSPLFIFRLRVSGVFYNGPCAPGGLCTNFIPFRYTFEKANATEMTISNKMSDVSGSSLYSCYCNA